MTKRRQVVPATAAAANLLRQEAEDAFVHVVAAAWCAAWADPYTDDLIRADLVSYIEQYILSGVDETQHVIELAKRDNFYDDVLRRLYRNMIDRGEMPNATLRAYGLTPVWRKRGRKSADEGYSILLAMFVSWIAQSLGMNRTRDQSSSADGLPPSGAPTACSIMARALALCGGAKSEARVQNMCSEVERTIGDRFLRQDGGIRGRVRSHLSKYNMP